MKKLYILLILAVVSFSTKSQINNATFENWDTTHQSSNHVELTSQYNVKNPKAGKPSYWSPEYDGILEGIVQTTDAFAGDFALLIHTWYHHVVGLIQYKDTLTQTPGFLNGVYKYEGHLQDGTWSNALGRIVLFAGGDTVAYGETDLAPKGSYTAFEIELNYSPAQLLTVYTLFF